MKAVTVFNGQGFIGSKVAKEFKNRGYQVDTLPMLENSIQDKNFIEVKNRVFDTQLFTDYQIDIPEKNSQKIGRIIPINETKQNETSLNEINFIDSHIMQTYNSVGNHLEESLNIKEYSIKQNSKIEVKHQVEEDQILISITIPRKKKEKKDSFLAALVNSTKFQQEYKIISNNKSIRKTLL